MMMLQTCSCHSHLIKYVQKESDVRLSTASRVMIVPEDRVLKGNKYLNI